jgi:glycosyl transferase family 2
MENMMTEDQLLHHSIQHLHGPKEIPYADDELIVLCLVRDGQPYLKTFVDHYFSLGVKHIVFLDNDSSDDTVSDAARYENVTVLRTKLSFKSYQYAMRRYLITRFGKKGRWGLRVDIDELFDYPYSDVVNLDSFLRYLTSKSYTAVMAHMLDMFPEKSLSDQPDDLGESLKEVHRFYDISNLMRKSVNESARLRRHNNAYESHAMEIFQGGIRTSVFGHSETLSKQPLVFLDGKIKPMDDAPRWVSNAKVADLTCVLFHYKFLDGYFHAQARQAVREEQHRDNSARYKKYLEVLEKNPRLQVKQATAKEVKNVNDLLEEQFLVVSEDYVSWVNAQEEKRVLLHASQRDSCWLTKAYLASRHQERARILKMQRLAQQLRQQLRELQKAKQRAEKRAEKRAQKRAQKLEQQLERMQESRAWKLVKMLQHIKTKISLAGGRGDIRKET